MKLPSAKKLHRRWAMRLALLPLLSSLLVSLTGCSAFNPAFVDLLDPTGQSAQLDNSTGHVVLGFVNNASVNERIINYLESADGGSLTFTDAERRALKPLIRFRVQVTFTDETQQVIEFISGSRFVHPLFSDLVAQDLDQPDFTNGVVLCDVQRVELVPEAPIEVFVPVPIEIFEFVDPTDNTPGFFRSTNEIFAPAFRALQDDVVLANGTVILGNLSQRDAPSPVSDPRCGSVISYTVSGELSVPFLGIEGVGNNPSVDEGSLAQLLSIGGRYAFNVALR